MYYRIINNEIIKTYPNNIKEIYLPDLDIHIKSDQFENFNIYRETNQSIILSENEYISSYDFQIIDGRPVNVPIVVTKTVEEMENELIQWRENTSVSALQALLAIDAAGLSVPFKSWCDDTNRTFAERAFIDKATVWKRNDSTLIAGATSLGLTDVQLDDLFKIAQTL